MSRSWLLLVAVVSSSAIASSASAQKIDPYTARIAMGDSAYTWEASSGPAQPTRLPPVAARPSAPAIDPTANRVLNYYKSQQARQTLAQMPGRTGAGVAAMRPMVRSPKPFNTVVQSPTVSPYLNLYREDEGDGAPNYFAFVRPQQDQIEANTRAALQVQRLQGQLRAAEGKPIGPYSNSGAAARYGDTGRYYGNWRR
jgi:hypothetical protein